MDGRLTRTYCDEAGDYVVPNVLSPRDLVSRPDNMDETVLSSCLRNMLLLLFVCKNDKFLMKIYDNGLRDIQQNKNWKLKNQHYNQRIPLNKVESARFIQKKNFHS